MRNNKQDKSNKDSSPWGRLGGVLLPWLQITLGCFIVAMGFVVFINPYKMVPGGVYGSSIVLHQLWPELQVGTYGYILQIPLMILTTLLVGRKLGVRTLFTVLVTPLIMNVATWLSYPTEEAMRALDADTIFGGGMNLSDHLIIAAVFGGLMVGAGSGLIIRNQSGTGGTDLVGMILNKYLHVKFSRAILYVDATIILLGLIVTHSLLLSLYSLIAVVMINISLNYAITGSRDAKIIYIICRQQTEEISRFILNDLDATATVVPCRGLYSGEDKDMLMLVVRDKLVPRITKSITAIAPEAFLIVADAYETFGLRWRKFPAKDELML